MMRKLLPGAVATIIGGLTLHAGYVFLVNGAGPDVPWSERLIRCVDFPAWFLSYPLRNYGGGATGYVFSGLFCILLTAVLWYWIGYRIHQKFRRPSGVDWRKHSAIVVCSAVVGIAIFLLGIYTLVPHLQPSAEWRTVEAIAESIWSLAVIGELLMWLGWSFARDKVLEDPKADPGRVH